MSDSATSAPLAGIKVVEITSIYSGPFAGMILGELGADVIKVESQGKPDLIRNQGGANPYAVAPTFYSLNKGKRFVSIDGRNPEGRALLVDLVAGADIFLNNIRPGKPDGLGLAYAELAARNPRIIHCSITGLGSSGPDADKPVYDYVIQARSGMVDYQRDVLTGNSSLISQVLVDKTSSQAAVQAILAALYVRERTGRGQQIEIPMIGVGLHFEWPDAVAPFMSQVNPAIPPSMLPTHMATMPAAALVVMKTKDGGEIASSPALPPYDGFCIALDHPEWVVDERYADNMNRAMNFPSFKAELLEAALQFTTDELMARLAENGVAAGLVKKRTEIHEDPQVKHLGLIHEHTSTHDAIGAVRAPVPMWHFSESKSVITTRIGRCGEDTREVLAEMGIAADRIAALHDSGAVASPE
jgi:crotonobetainyl-CoA:carnitine CoA-transferase CaiB-like acyl-CoA transferase